MSLDDARTKMEDWRKDYNEVRPHSAIGNNPPSYARKLVTAISGGVFDLLDTVLEFHSLDDLGELA